MASDTSFDLGPLLRAAADDLQAPVTGETRWLCAGPVELGALTPGDRDLVQVVTGERLPRRVHDDIPISFFALQIAVDRLVGPLRDGAEISIVYVEDVYTRYEPCPDATPITGEHLDLALAYLAGRELAFLGPDA